MKLFAAILSTIILLLGAKSAHAQDDHIVPGKLIILLNKEFKGDPAYVAELFEYAGLKPERCLSKDLGIWLCSYGEGIEGKALVRSLVKEKWIEKVQHDHYINLRDVLPDDPSFAMQWALYNIGQSGGVIDADIDATKAWEINVNEGTTLLGDSIVIAVIDDGFDLEHEDMNFWKNSNEIPGNGIDDDNNGYIDDYDGWNAFSASGDIPERSHGTRVAGVAGAVGNNGIGISGVGWNCKVMPIAGSSTFESTVVAAFSYVYKMRSLYEETNGEKGAFVVVTNGSFGVDFANPENYPVWGMMYDSLGSLGILSSAATMNHESNVDIVGDVPTNFDTDYLIGVTNTTQNDAKYNIAAWGPVSIDLGAPGTGILSTRPNNTYGYTTGTSLAAPQLTGSIGLLFAAADEQFLHKYEQDPGEAASFLKDIILDNVDTLQGFDTLCVSGGRLNVDHALKALLAPRMLVEMDTLIIYLGQDTAANSMILLSNLAGFELAYDCGFITLPEWIALYPTGGNLTAYGNDNLGFGINTAGLALGTYYSTLEIRDAGGWIIPLVLELNVVDDTGIKEKTEKTVLKNAYPNPFTEQIILRIALNEVAELRFNIYSLSGERVDAWQGHYAKGEHSIERYTPSLSSGIYIIEIRGDNISDRLKVVKTAR